METQEYVRDNIFVVDENEVISLCVDLEFDNNRIMDYLSQYATNPKYEGLDEFEWRTVTAENKKKTKRQEQAERRSREE